MKNFSLLKSRIIIITISVMLVFLCSCTTNEQIEYYSQKDNYITATGTVSFINFDDDYKTLYIGFTELSPTFDDTCFKLVGKNLEKLKDNKNVDKIKIGEKITFITAPKYFGDGYVMPIVQISINGECLLEFNEGYTNFLGWLSNTGDGSLC